MLPRQTLLALAALDAAGARLTGSRPRLESLVIAGEASPWQALGFAVDGDRFQVGSVEIRLAGGGEEDGILGWSLAGTVAGPIDGLPDAPAPESSSPPRSRDHPNGALAIDHVVVVTPDLERTLDALERAGLEQRRRREADSPAGTVNQAFYRVGEVVLEVVAPPGAAAGPASFWGLVFTVADLEACAAWLGDRLGEVRDAVQPGRRIATVRRDAELGVAVALMSVGKRQVQAVQFS